MKILNDLLQTVQGGMEQASLTWLGIAALAVILVGCGIGYHRGFVKEVLSTLFLFLAIGIVWFVNPYVNQFLKESTPVYKTVQSSCESYLNKIDIQQTLDQKTEEVMVEELKLPKAFAQEIVKNNTAEMYEKMGVSSFLEYLVDSIANIITNGISFLISFVLAYVLLRVLGFVLDLFSKLPVLHGINKLAGAVLGGGKCILILWIAMIVVTIFWNSVLAETVAEDQVLNFLYTSNPIGRLFAGVGYGM